MNDLELKLYAEAIIYAFEFKKTIKAKALTVREFGVVCEHINHHLKSQNKGIISAVEALNQPTESQELA